MHSVGFCTSFGCVVEIINVILYSLSLVIQHLTLAALSFISSNRIIPSRLMAVVIIALVVLLSTPVAALYLRRPCYCSLTLCNLLWPRPLTLSQKTGNSHKEVNFSMSSIPAALLYTQRLDKVTATCLYKPCVVAWGMLAGLCQYFVGFKSILCLSSTCQAFVLSKNFETS